MSEARSAAGAGRASDPSLTPASGMAAVIELVNHLDMIELPAAGDGDRDRRHPHRDARGAATDAGRGPDRDGHDRGLDTTDVEVSGRHKRRVAYNYSATTLRPHVATWAETATPLAADLMSDDEDPCRHGRALVPTRRHTGALTLRLPSGHHLFDEVLTRLRALPAPS